MTDKNEDLVEQLIADGISHHDSGDIEQARDYYLQALDLDPHNAKALDLAGLLCMQCGETEAAKDFYATAIQIEPKNTRYLLHLGILLLEQNDIRESEVALRKVMELDPDHADARFYIALGMRASNRREDAKVILKAAQEIDRENASYSKWQGLLSLETGDLVSALEFSNHAIELDAGDVTTFVQLGVILNALADPELAERTFRSGLQVDPDDIRCRSGLAATLIDLDRKEEAQQELDRATEINGEGHPSLLSVIALSDSLNNNKTEAREKIEQALDMDSASLEILLTAYKVMKNIGDDSAAEKLLEDMQEIAPDDARVMELLLG
tara:strand:- start:561 stop:1535 length:975 start_codon:yes stop_codon:yes gene_type:complete